MQKTISTRLIAVAISIVLGLAYFLPSLPDDVLPESLSSYLPGDGINLGLDLQGGIHLVLRVERHVAVDNAMDRTSDGLAQYLSEDDQLTGVSVAREGDFHIRVRYTDDSQLATINELIEKRFSTLVPFDTPASDPIIGEDPGDGASSAESLTLQAEPNSLLLRLKDTERQTMLVNAVVQSVESIRNRIDQFGVAEPLIQQQGIDEILVQLPGVSDPDRAIALIGKTALLEFKLVDESVSPFGEIPDDDEILYQIVKDPATGLEVDRQPYVVKKKAMLTGETLTDARVSIGQFNEPLVAISFDAVGARIFGQVTGDHIKERFAIVLDDNIHSAPVIQDKIDGGQAQITGNFTPADANDLAIVLRAGSLPAPVTILQNVTVGPSLGHDSIKAGITATLSGFLLVVLFMTIYYRLSGLIANFAMFLNVLLLLGALGAINATLTLPGIAGILLTIGMGVDSNVLIFERIREELRIGKTVRLAIDQGYNRALVTIVDAHVTTLITAVVLFLFGSGPVKGFAVTLSLGILINYFTAFVGTKVLFDWMNSGKRLTKLSI